jgi:hypothetical protein
MTDTVVAFPRFNLPNVAESLRKLANDIERDPGKGVRVVVVMETDAGDTDYKAFGPDPFTRAHACGLCFAVATDIVKDSQ